MTYVYCDGRQCTEYTVLSVSSNNILDIKAFQVVPEQCVERHIEHPGITRTREAMLINIASNNIVGQPG